MLPWLRLLQSFRLGGRQAGHEARANANARAHENRPACNAIVVPFHIASPRLPGLRLRCRLFAGMIADRARTAAGGEAEECGH